MAAELQVQVQGPVRQQRALELELELEPELELELEPEPERRERAPGLLQRLALVLVLERQWRHHSPRQQWPGSRQNCASTIRCYRSSTPGHLSHCASYRPFGQLRLLPVPRYR